MKKEANYQSDSDDLGRGGDESDDLGREDDMERDDDFGRDDHSDDFGRGEEATKKGK